MTMSMPSAEDISIVWAVVGGARVGRRRRRPVLGAAVAAVACRWTG